jgi:hypothetical protein
MIAGERTSTSRRPDAELAAEHAARRQTDNAEILRARRLLDEKVSVERVWFEIQASRGRAVASTVEALIYSLRAGGAALACPHARRRLSELSEAQLQKCLHACRNSNPTSPEHGHRSRWSSWWPYGSICMDEVTKVSVEALQRIRDQRKDLMAGGSRRESAPVQSK